MEETKQIEVTIKFYLPDHEHEVHQYLNSSKAYSVLFDVDQMCRTQLKHGDGDEKVDAFAQRIRDEVNAVLFRDWYE